MENKQMNKCMNESQDRSKKAHLEEPSTTLNVWVYQNLIDDVKMLTGLFKTRYMIYKAIVLINNYADQVEHAVKLQVK